MNGIDLMNNLVKELIKCRDLLADTNETKLVNDIRKDLDRYYDYADSFDAVLEDIEIED